MPKWTRTLDLSQEWGRAKSGEIPPQELAGIIAVRLNAMRRHSDDIIDEARDDLVTEFESFADDPGDSDDFNIIMGELYDWADMKISGGFSDAEKVCWVKTF